MSNWFGSSFTIAWFLICLARSAYRSVLSVSYTWTHKREREREYLTVLVRYLERLLSLAYTHASASAPSSSHSLD